MPQGPKDPIKPVVQRKKKVAAHTKVTNKEQALQKKLEAAFVEDSRGSARAGQDPTQWQKTHVPVDMGLWAPQDSPLAWGFRAILERDQSFSLLHDRQGSRILGVISDTDRKAFKRFVDVEVLPVLQLNSQLVGHGSNTVYYHFKWASPLGVIRASTTTRGRSGYVYGVVYLEATDALS